MTAKLWNELTSEQHERAFKAADAEVRARVIHLANDPATSVDEMVAALTHMRIVEAIIDGAIKGGGLARSYQPGATPAMVAAGVVALLPITRHRSLEACMRSVWLAMENARKSEKAEQP